MLLQHGPPQCTSLRMGAVVTVCAVRFCMMSSRCGAQPVQAAVAAGWVLAGDLPAGCEPRGQLEAAVWGARLARAVSAGI